MLATMKGIRRPQRLRQRSLFTLMYGEIVIPIRLGMVERIIPISQFGHCRFLRCSGTMLGTTVSISVKQKSPQSSQTNSIVKAVRV